MNEFIKYIIVYLIFCISELSVTFLKQRDAKKCNYDCLKCKNWDCFKLYCDEKRKKENENL